MQRETVNPVLTNFYWDLILANWQVPAFAPNIRVRLYKAGPANPSMANVWADYTECDFTGYAFVVIDPTTLISQNMPNGNGHGSVLPALFTAGALGASQNAIGYVVTDDDVAPKVYFAEKFSVAVPFAVNGDFLDLSAFIPFFQIGSVS